MNALDEATRTTDVGTVRMAALLSIVALVVSVWTAALSVDDDATVRELESRLACLELPGPNECGIDGR